MALALYSPEDVIILLGGIYEVNGLHEGSFVSISETSQRYTTSVTADGRVSRTHMNVPVQNIEITLSSISDSNQVFSSWAFADSKLYGAMVPLYIKDNSGSTLFFSPMTWIESVPSVTLSEGVEARTWTLKSAGGSKIIGGNYRDGIIDSDLVGLGLIGADLGGIL